MITNRLINKGWAKGVMATLALILMAPVAWAQQEGGPSSAWAGEQLVYVVLVFTTLVSLLVLIAAVMTYRLVVMVYKKEEAQVAAAQGEEVVEEEEPSLWQQLSQKMTQAVPVEEEETIMLHHDYDGIKELDNHLPPWWKWLFYATIVFSIIYLLNYHVFHWSPLQHEEYEQQMERAEAAIAAYKEKAASSIDESSVSMATEEAMIEEGKSIYQQNCAACHKQDGGGQVGPNLTDNYWIHGGSLSDVFSTIKYGVPEKGMVPWQGKLTPMQMQNVASYILTQLHGTEPADPKEPQGEFVAPADSTSAAADRVKTEE